VVVGDICMVVYDDMNADEPVKIYDRGFVRAESTSFGEHQLTYRYGDTLAPTVSSEEPLAREIAHFLSCITTGAPCISDGAFGLRVVRVLEAADRSWREGQVPVALDDFSDQQLVV
jgi:predicted dehydrogenase